MTDVMAPITAPDAGAASTGTGRPAAGPCLTAWHVTSAAGVDAVTFETALAGPHPGPTPIDRGRWPDVPVDEAFVVPDFTPATQLGRKGTRSMDRVTGLSVHAVGALLRDRAPSLIPGGSGEIGLVLGTGMGSANSIMSFTRDSLLNDKPFHVDPARFPNTVMNCAAGQSAIWHRLRGPNVTIAGGHTTGLLALSYVRRLLRQGYVETILCGAAEEFSQERAWLERHARGRRLDPPLGEGCAVFIVESAAAARRSGRAVLAELAALSFGVVLPSQEPGPQLATCAGQAIAAAEVSPADVGVLAPSPYDVSGQLNAVAQVLGAAPDTVVLAHEVCGDTASASAMFQVAAVLCATRGDIGLAGRAALVTSVDPGGTIGCAVLRLPTSGSAP